MTLVVHDQTCALHEHLVAGALDRAVMQALEVSVVDLCALVIHSQFAEGVAWQNLQASVASTASHGHFSSPGLITIAKSAGI